MVQVELTASDLALSSDPLLDMRHLQHPDKFVLLKHGLKPRLLLIVMSVEGLTIIDFEF